MRSAPFRNDLAEGPEGGSAVWTEASDGVRLRVGGWHTGSSGTVLLFNGRTEYIEKYGRMAQAFACAGLSTASMDWRGQGFSDRVAADPMLGHVAAFTDYQHDVAAFLETARALGFPQPFHLVGHSMGGAIGLRALCEGLPVERAVFSAPMWGIALPRWLRPLSGAILQGAHVMGRGLAYAPGTGPKPYPFRQPFEGNELTHDPECYEWLCKHIRTEPCLGLGGPSMNWLREAFAEFRHFEGVSDVPCPVLALVGSDEAIVRPDAIAGFARRWANAKAETIAGARHEAMMELPPVREDFARRTLTHLLAC